MMFRLDKDRLSQSVLMHSWRIMRTKRFARLSSVGLGLFSVVVRLCSVGVRTVYFTIPHFGFVNFQKAEENFQQVEAKSQQVDSKKVVSGGRGWWLEAKVRGRQSFFPLSSLHRAPHPQH